MRKKNPIHSILDIIFLESFEVSIQIILCQCLNHRTIFLEFLEFPIKFQTLVCQLPAGFIDLSYQLLVHVIKFIAIMGYSIELTLKLEYFLLLSFYLYSELLHHVLVDNLPVSLWLLNHFHLHKCF